MSTTYRVKEFADLSGVTVRTLQYYDRIGLLKPSGYTKKNHRLYQIEDLLRLQQILTFKHVGYGLDDIRRMVDSPDYDVVNALKAQQEAIRDRIAQLQKVAKSIDSTIDALASVDTKGLDWRLVRNVIAEILASDRWNWAHDYYTPAQKKMLAKRQRNIKPEQMTTWQKQWAEIMLGFQRLLDRKRNAADAEAQALAARAEAMLEKFTGGNKGIERSLGRAYANYEAVPKDRRPFPLELQRFASEAWRIYRKNKR